MFEKQKKPKYTIIIPTHNRANLLRRSIKSVKSQTISFPHELIVISDIKDFETDRVANELLEYSDVFINRSGKPGPSLSRNIGLDMAKGDYIIFLDDDDGWHDNFIEQLENSLTFQNEKFIYCDCTVIKESRLNNHTIYNNSVNLDNGSRLTEDVFVKNQIHMSCFIFPKEIIDKIRFDPHMRAYEDWDFLLSVFEVKFPKHARILASKVFEVDDDTTDRRGSSMDANNLNALLDYLYVYRKHPTTHPLQIKRQNLIKTVGLNIPEEFL